MDKSGRLCGLLQPGMRDAPLRAVLNLSPKAHTKTDTSSQEKLFGEIQNSF
ncbi:hypothetical protein QUW14_08875 [Bacteroides gallinaceum]|uniref:hypothetical protein n=1 Tax=Bacteroides gallinaceum TaxID=1462571 RepID=UPI0025A336AD|nr:hypothetical protein [Bacteroides gallinaceum]MDM8154421.1 hypothetical protein [Bacteroides gallinaceum]